MAEQNVPAQPSIRTDEQNVPRSQWLIIGKINLLFNAQKIQKNPIFQISVDILSNTNFFRAFTASASGPAIYMQQLWNTMKYDEKTGVYSCQVDEQWFDLSVDLLRKALAITPIIPAHSFELPPSGNTVIDFVNELGYPEPVEILALINISLSVTIPYSIEVMGPVAFFVWGWVPMPGILRALPRIYRTLFRKIVDGLLPRTCLYGNVKREKVTPMRRQYIVILTIAGTLAVKAKHKRDYFLMLERRYYFKICPLIFLKDVVLLNLFGAIKRIKVDFPIIITESESTTLQEKRCMCEERTLALIKTEYLKNAHEDLAGPDPKPMQEDQTRSDSGKVHMSLAGPKPGHYG
ncbi:hypothetical protein Tco_0475537 [Tanacetum coccineum]